VEENNPPVQHPGGRIVPGQIIRIWSAQPKDANLENTLQLQEEAVIEEKEIEASISSITNMRVSDSETQAKSEKPTNTAQATKNKIVFPVNSSWVLGLLFVLITLLLGYFFYSKTGSNTKNRQQLKKMQREVQFYKSQGDRHL
jgi:hypothetical protein